MGKKRYTLVLNFGFAETQHLGYMPWTSNVTFSDAKDAVLDLAQYLQTVFKQENCQEPKQCCLKTKVADATAEFCSKCGRELEDDSSFDEEYFEDWLRGLNTDIDTFHGLVPWEKDPRWLAGELEGAPNPRFVYQAEWVILAALGYPANKKTFKEICKARTKSKKTSFSGY